jgi:hypothetical protein
LKKNSNIYIELFAVEFPDADVGINKDEKSRLLDGRGLDLTLDGGQLEKSI